MVHAVPSAPGLVSKIDIAGNPGKINTQYGGTSANKTQPLIAQEAARLKLSLFIRNSLFKPTRATIPFAWISRFSSVKDPGNYVPNRHPRPSFIPTSDPPATHSHRWLASHVGITVTCIGIRAPNVAPLSLLPMALSFVPSFHRQNNPSPEIIADEKGLAPRNAERTPLTRSEAGLRFCCAGLDAGFLGVSVKREAWS